MNNRQIATFLVGAVVASASTLSVQAADRSARFEPATPHQAAEDAWYDAERERGSSRSLADIPFPVPPTAAAPYERPATAHQAAEDAWYDAERERGSSRSLADIPFPVPPTAAAPYERPGTAYDDAENRWLSRERRETDGNVAPVPFPVPATAR